MQDTSDRPAVVQQSAFAQLLIGGVFRLLPAAVVLFLLKILVDVFRPLSASILEEFNLVASDDGPILVLTYDYLAPIALAVLVLFGFSGVERILRIRMLNAIFTWVEAQVVGRFPLLGDLYGVVRQSSERLSKPMLNRDFGEPVIVVDDVSRTWRYGFRTAQVGRSVAVFIPFGPLPTHGPVLHYDTSMVLAAFASRVEVSSDVVGLGTATSANKERDCAMVAARWRQMGLIQDAPELPRFVSANGSTAVR